MIFLVDFRTILTDIFVFYFICTHYKSFGLVIQIFLKISANQKKEFPMETMFFVRSKRNGIFFVVVKTNISLNLDFRFQKQELKFSIVPMFFDRIKTK
jgi:hypothetical protein